MAEPVFDPQILKVLGDELGSRAAAHRFAAAYIGLADERASRIQFALVCGDLDDALDITRSLRVGAVMAGAVALAATATCVERALQGGSAAPRCAIEVGALLPKAVARASMAIDAYLREAASPGVSIR